MRRAMMQAGAGGAAALGVPTRLINIPSPFSTSSNFTLVGLGEVDGRVLSIGRTPSAGGASTGSTFFVLNTATTVAGTAYPINVSDVGVSRLNDGRILVIGGFTSTAMAAYTASNAQYIGTISGNTITWVAAGTYAAALGSVGACTLPDGRVFTCFGTTAALATSNTAFLLTVTGNSVARVATTVPPVFGNPSVLPDGRIYLAASDTAYIGTVTGNTISWVQVAAAPANIGSNVSEYGKGAALVNAITGSGYSQTTVYTPESTWETKPCVPSQTAGLGFSVAQMGANRLVYTFDAAFNSAATIQIIEVMDANSIDGVGACDDNGTASACYTYSTRTLTRFQSFGATSPSYLKSAICDPLGRLIIGVISTGNSVKATTAAVSKYPGNIVDPRIISYLTPTVAATDQLVGGEFSPDGKFFYVSTSNTTTFAYTNTYVYARDLSTDVLTLIQTLTGVDAAPPSPKSITTDGSSYINREGRKYEFNGSQYIYVGTMSDPLNQLFFNSSYCTDVAASTGTKTIKRVDGLTYTPVGAFPVVSGKNVSAVGSDAAGNLYAAATTATDGVITTFSGPPEAFVSIGNITLATTFMRLSYSPDGQALVTSAVTGSIGSVKARTYRTSNNGVTNTINHFSAVTPFGLGIGGDIGVNP